MSRRAASGRLRWAAALACALVAGGAGGAWGAFTATTSTPPGTFSSAAAATTTGPAIAAATVQRDLSAGQTTPPGTFRQGAPYRMYAQLAAGSPASAVTATATSFDGDATAEPLTATGGPWTVDGTEYSHRSEELTADTGLRTGAGHPWSVTATDEVERSATVSRTATAQTYASVLQATAGLVAHYPLSDGAVAADDFTGTAGSALAGREARLGGTWTTRSGSAGVVLTAAGRVRRAASGTASLDTGAVPPSADYRVEADLHLASVVAGDAAGLTARSGPFGIAYLARYRDGRWELVQNWGQVNETLAPAVTDTLPAGVPRRLGLQVEGSTITLLVNGVPTITDTDTELKGTGHGGVWLDGSTPPTDTTGLHLDDVRVTTLTTTMAPRAGAPGTYHGGTATNQPGALVSDVDGAARFDGVDDDGTTARQVEDDFSVEFWFRSAGGSSAGGSWKDGAGLVDASVVADDRDVGTSLTADRRVVAGHRTAGSYANLVSDPLDAGWHHVVLTRAGGDRAVLHIDGAPGPSVATGADPLDASDLLAIGRLAGGGQHFTGLIDEVALYSVSLSPETVADHHAAGRGTG